MFNLTSILGKHRTQPIEGSPETFCSWAGGINNRKYLSREHNSSMHHTPSRDAIVTETSFRSHVCVCVCL